MVLAVEVEAENHTVVVVVNVMIVVVQHTAGKMSAVARVVQAAAKADVADNNVNRNTLNQKKVGVV